MPAFAEQPEEIVEVEPPDAGELQLEQRVLPRIGIHGVDRGRAGEGVVEHVAAGARDHEHPVARDVERLAVNGGVLPAGVVDERPRYDGLEESPVQALGQRGVALRPGSSVLREVYGPTHRHRSVSAEDDSAVKRPESAR